MDEGELRVFAGQLAGRSSATTNAAAIAAVAPGAD